MRSAVIVAAGKGERFNGDKIFLNFCGAPVLLRATLPFLHLCGEAIVVVNENDVEKARTLFASMPAVKIVAGGKTRQQSVLNGLDALSPRCRTVAVHDGARPFISEALAKICFEQAEKHGSAVPVVPSSDSVYFNGAPVDRNGVRLAQTPQTFDAEKIKQAYSELDGAAADDATVYFGKFGSLNFVEGETSNKKITYPSDLPDIRTGCGFDLHTLEKGRRLILGGREIPCDAGLKGYSDADVLLHALTDALLCAAGERDIGCLFPDSDEKFKDADSSIFLYEASKRAREKGFAVMFAAADLIAQKPKLAPHIPAIRASVAKMLDVPAGLVNISAKTAEKQGTIGGGKAIACDATVTLMKID